MNKYIIVGDTDKYKDCLICVCGSSEEIADKTLQRMVNTPTDNDKKLIAGHHNLRVLITHEDGCWWQNNCD